MQIHISASDGVPIYLQIVNQVKYLVASGRLAPGEELPPIRVLAERLVVNPNTVARAYRELESAGVVEKRRTAGTFVSESGSPLARRERLKILTERVDALLAEARQLGIGVDEVVELIGRRNQAMQPPGETKSHDCRDEGQCGRGRRAVAAVRPHARAGRGQPGRAARRRLRAGRRKRRRQDDADQAPARSLEGPDRDGAGLRARPGARAGRRCWRGSAT